ncbi:MAG: dockerin type I domain-containing protein [Oscillospiraceae bacterium]
MNILKKYIIRILCIIIFNGLFSLNVSVNANSSEWVYNESGQVLYLYEIEIDEVTITAGGNLNDIIIPNYVEDYPITKIASKSFFLNPYYMSITLPETLVTIEKEAILSCENIKEITIPRNVQNIGEHALGYEMRLVPVCGSTETYIAFYRMDDFIIKGYKGTAAETYALQNRFTFIALDDEPITTTTTVTTDVTTTETTVVTTQTTAICTTSAAETTPITTTVTIPEIKGDANGDGKLAASDAAFIAKELAQSSISGEKITAEDYPSMDFNQDGKITAKDAADIARYLAEQSIT